MVVELTKALMAIPSVTGEEKGLAEFLDKLLAQMGFSVERQPVGSEQQERFNVIAIMGRPRVLLATHMDTVPPQIPSDEDEDHIYGRGACDAKGIIAAMIEAGKQLLRDGVRDFGYLFTVGEEIDSIGAKKAAELDLDCEWIIVGEPTENKLAIGHKGSLSFTLRARGRAAHSAYPERGESAIDKLLDVLDDLRRADFGRDALLGQATLNIGIISGGVRANVVAESAQASVMIRTVTSADEVEDKVRAIVGARAEIDVIARVGPQLMTRPQQVEGLETTVVSFGTDIPYLRDLGQPLLIGPGSILDAHGPEEKISKRQLKDAVRIYYELVSRLM